MRSVPSTWKHHAPCPEILLRIACFDAYAAAFEFVDDPGLASSLRRLDPQAGYQQHPRHLDLLASLYTDDTERAIANVHVVTDGAFSREERFTKRNFARAYVYEFNRSGRRKGYARGFQALMEAAKDGDDLLAKIRPHSCRNGAAMGAGVLGALPTVERILFAAAVQASVTHNTRCGIFTARVAALATHFSLYERDPLGRLRAYLLDHRAALVARFADEEECGHGDLFDRCLADPWTGPCVNGRNGEPIGIETIRAALALAIDPGTLVGALDGCLAWGGDTDSVAAIAAAILAPRCRGEDLPEFLARDLEFCSPETGAPRLLELGGRLMRCHA